MSGSYRKPPVCAIEDLGLELGVFRGDPVEELARYGAQLVLTAYIEAEVSAHLARRPYERTPDAQYARLRPPVVVFCLPLVGESRGYDFEILAPVLTSYTIASTPERDECHNFRRRGG